MAAALRTHDRRRRSAALLASGAVLALVMTLAVAAPAFAAALPESSLYAIIRAARAETYIHVFMYMS